MYTVCPRCTLTLAVTAEDLRAGQGHVRCGRCLNVFNALLALSEEQEQAQPDQAAPVYTAAEPASISQISRALQAASQAGATPPSPPSVPVGTPTPAGTQVPAETPVAAEAPPRQLPTEVSSDGAIEMESTLAEGTGTFETIVLEGDAITQTEEFAPQEAVDHEIAALAQRLRAAPAAAEAAKAAESTDTATAHSADADAAGAAPATTADADDHLSALGLGAYGLRPASSGHHRGWLIGSVLLALLLVAQAVNHWRDTLASKPALSAPVTRLFALFGIQLDPHWDLNAYDIRQQGAVSDPGDSHLIRVRLSVANHAARAQPAPLLRLTLLDRYGKRLAARDLTPADYWPRGQTPRSFLRHDERIDSEIAVRDQSTDSASFELDVCLRNLRGVVHCAGDVSPPAAGAT